MTNSEFWGLFFVIVAGNVCCLLAIGQIMNKLDDILKKLSK